MTELSFRIAAENDLGVLVQMLADDTLGRTREDVSTPINQNYIDIFQRINADPHNELVVACLDQKIVGMLQLTFIPYLSYTGSWRCLIEGVRVHSGYRGQGFGKQLIMWSIQRAMERGCRLVQLTSDKSRTEAITFYESLGFVASHEGFKLHLKR